MAKISDPSQTLGCARRHNLTNKSAPTIPGDAAIYTT
jgi:hypothetical protein